MKSDFALKIAPFFGYLLMRFIVGSLRMTILRYHPVERHREEGRNVIFAFWHGRLAIMPFFGAQKRFRRSRLYGIISQHRDGEFLVRIIKRFGIDAIRGSTTRGGAGALRESVKVLKGGMDLGLTPDGPKGPRHEVQSGVIELARLTGVSIVPVTFGASKKKPSPAGTDLFSPFPSPGRCSCLGSL